MDLDTARAMTSGTRIVHRTLGSGKWAYRSRIDGPTAAWIVLDGHTDMTLIDYDDVDTEPRIQNQRWSHIDGDQVDLDMLARDIAFVSRGTVFLYPTNTHRDDMGFVLSDRELTDDEVRAAAGMTPKETGK